MMKFFSPVENKMLQYHEKKQHSNIYGCIIMLICLLGIFACIIVFCWFFFKIDFFEKFF